MNMGWILLNNFFGWSLDSSAQSVFIKNHNEHLRYLMETMKQDWITIQAMPYKFFLETIKWKVDLEEKKAKHMAEEHEKMERKQKSQQRMAARNR